jgi:hypothetical protein
MDTATEEELTAVQEGLPVRLIATARSELSTCHVDEPVSTVLARNSARFDHWPVLDNDSRIVGLLDLTQFHSKPPTGPVSSKMVGLDETNLMGADASIISFIRTAHNHACRLLLGGPEISGLVTVSDLHKLPVRVALFCLITNLETVMAKAIEREAPSKSVWLQRLSASRQEKLAQRIDDATKEKTEIHDDLLYTELCDKGTIISKSPRFSGMKAEFKIDIKEIQLLRDKVAHANNYASQAIEVTKLSSVVAKMDKWTKFLATGLHSHNGSTNGAPEKRSE